MPIAQTEQPRCTHCGEEYEGPVAQPFWQWADCGFCMRRFKVPGNPNVPMTAYRRPFWTDQFRMGREDGIHPPAGLDGLMYTIVGLFGFCGLTVVAFTIAAIIRFGL